MNICSAIMLMYCHICSMNVCRDAGAVNVSLQSDDDKHRLEMLSKMIYSQWMMLM